MKIVFFGDSFYSNIILEKLNKTKYKPNLIITKNSLPQTVCGCEFDIGILASYGKIISKNMINNFKYGILNIHPSLLPKYRGSSPLQQSIINGDKITGVSIIKMIDKIDAGPIIKQKEFIIDKKYTTKELGEILFNLGADLVIDILKYLKKSKSFPNSFEQNEKQATYTSLIKKEYGKINWKEKPEIIERKIRAYKEWPIAYTYANIKNKKGDIKTLRIQILEALIKDNKLAIKIVRPEGKHTMNFNDFLRGYSFQGFLS